MTMLAELCAICADGPPLEFVVPALTGPLPPGTPPLPLQTLSAQQLAGWLLGQELTARLEAIPDFYDTSAFTINIAQGGVWRGLSFFSLLAPVGPLPNSIVLGGGCIPGVKEAADPRAYGALMSTLQPQIDALGAAVVAASGPNFIPAKRSLVSGGAAAGLPFWLTAMFTDSTPTFIVDAGSWRVQLSGDFIPGDTSVVPSTVSVFVGSSLLASRQRQYLRGRPSFHVETDDVITLSSPDVVTVVNSGAAGLSGNAILRVFAA